VVYVNYKYPHLNDLIFQLFQVEGNIEARNELIRLIGVMGALDCFNLFKLQSEEKISTQLLSSQELIKIIRSNHKSHFFFESKRDLTRKRNSPKILRRPF
jgi:hypothetical protein